MLNSAARFLIGTACTCESSPINAATLSYLSEYCSCFIVVALLEYDNCLHSGAFLR